MTEVATKERTQYVVDSTLQIPYSIEQYWLGILTAPSFTNKQIRTIVLGCTTVNKKRTRKEKFFRRNKTQLEYLAIECEKGVRFQLFVAREEHRNNCSPSSYMTIVLSEKEYQKFLSLDLISQLSCQISSYTVFVSMCRYQYVISVPLSIIYKLDNVREIKTTP